MADAVVTTVTEQQGDRVLLSVPMAGFPAGFQLRRGDQVTLIYDESGISARPLVKVVADGAQLQGGQARAEGNTFELSAAAVDNSEGASGNLVLFVVEQEGNTVDAGQVIAVRHRR